MDESTVSNVPLFTVVTDETPAPPYRGVQLYDTAVGTVLGLSSRGYSMGWSCEGAREGVGVGRG